MHEGTNVLISLNVILVVRNILLFWKIFVKPLFPILFVLLYFCYNILEEWFVLIIKLMICQSLKIFPLIFLHPLKHFCLSLILLRSSFQEQSYIHHIK